MSCFHGVLLYAAPRYSAPPPRRVASWCCLWWRDVRPQAPAPGATAMRRRNGGFVMQKRKMCKYQCGNPCVNKYVYMYIYTYIYIYYIYIYASYVCIYIYVIMEISWFNMTINDGFCQRATQWWDGWLILIIYLLAGSSHLGSGESGHDML